ncbi:hypothetical protein K4F52_003939 [Lecanicillium sp. MT-2017a]|nr:hypothetical protein K4F52_003939 [Lecanicillium sp. MT-2017a]
MAAPSSGPDGPCLASHATTISSASQCGDQASLSPCLAALSSSSTQSDLEACYTQAGCSPLEASTEAAAALDLCAELQTYHDLRRRHRAALDARMPLPTPGPNSPVFARDALHGDDCFKFDLITTTNCAVQTIDGKPTTLPCTDLETTTSSCLPDYTCTVDNGGGPICMRLHNSIDVGGVIIAIVFAAAIVLGIGLLTFLGCRESREQKRIAARVEASALARAATKKQRAQDRVPLMRQQDGPSAVGGADPFNDRNNI